jgi:PAS domain S-box-containing protein
VAALAAALVGLLAVVYLTASQVLLRTFARIESDDMQQRAAAVVEALGRELDALDGAALRWARASGAGGAGDAAAGAGRDTGVLIVAVAGGRAVPLGGAPGAAAAAVLQALGERAGAGSALFRHPHTESAVRGILRLPDGAALVAARPRLGARQPDVPGETVVAARRFDESVRDELAGAARVSLAVRPLPDPALPGDFAAALAADAGAGRTVVRPLAGGWVAAYRALADVDGRAAVALRVDAPRSVFLQGRSSFHYLMAALLVAALVLAGAAYGILERLVLRRVDWLSAHVNRIGASDSTGARIPVVGGDELAVLAGKINGMLDAVARLQGERGESEARYRAVFDQGGEGVILVDAETGRILDANRAAQRMLGYSFGELTALHAQDVVIDSAAVVSGHLDEVRRDRVVYAGDAVLRRKDGTQVVGEVTSTLVALRGRDVVCSVVRDAGERRRLEEQLRQTQRLEAVGRLASGVAHDVNNLLQAVSSAAALLRARGDDGTRARAADTLEAQVAAGAALTRQLSLIARHDRPASAPIDLNRVVADMGEFLRRVMRENVRLELEAAPGALPTVGDRGRLEQVLINLVANASDAMPAGGRATIRTGRDGETVWFEVCDRGPGIPPSLRERVFEPFFTTREGGQHAGLGLTVVQRIVDEHGGRITVTSRPGEGTAFRVALPVLPGGAPEEAASASEEAAAGAGGAAAVLLVEDGDDTRQGLAEMIALLGYSVVAFASAEEAMASAAADSADLLLTDYMLPGATGADLARSLLQRRPALRAIVMSGYAAEHAIPHGDPRLRFLAKPFGIDVLAAALRAALASATPAS